MNRKAFSLIELSIVILIIGILIAGVVQVNNLFLKATLKSAQSLTQSSPVQGITNLMVWYEATQDKSFGGSQPEDRTAIAKWYDIGLQKSPIDAIQSGSSQPLFIKECINNLPCLRFDGVNDFLISNININYTVMPEMTVFGVFRTYSSSNQAVFGHDNPEWDRFLFAAWSNQNGPGFSQGYSQPAPFPGISTILVPKFFSGVLRNGVSNGSKAYLNGAYSAASTFTESHNNLGDTSFAIGAISAISIPGQYPLNGDISEFILYNRALKNEERMAVEKYLSQKWGIKE